MRIIVPVFVDDMTLVSKSKEKITELKDELKKHFKLRDLGATEFLLGVKVEGDHSNRTLHLSQRQYTLDILKCFNFDSCSPVSSPLLSTLVSNCLKSSVPRRLLKWKKCTQCHMHML